MSNHIPHRQFPFLDRYVVCLFSFKDFGRSANWYIQLLQLLWRDFFYTAAFGTPNFDQMKGNSICKQVINSYPSCSQPVLLAFSKRLQTVVLHLSYCRLFYILNVGMYEILLVTDAYVQS